MYSNLGILDKDHRVISIDSEDYEKVAFQIRNLL